jgi:hypothetical protein
LKVNIEKTAGIKPSVFPDKPAAPYPITLPFALKIFTSFLK